MIEDALREVAAITSYSGALRAVISVPGGESVAEKTFNPQLGIVGGISILGTSGIVEPMSERALIDTIRLDIDTIRASGAKSLLITPGNYGRDFADSLGLTGVRAAKCSNFLGEAIDYATYCEFEDILIVAHVGKLVKVAAGVFNTHSRTADSRAEVFTAHAAICGADTETCRAVFDAKTADAAIAILKKSNIFEREIASISVKIAKNLKNRAKNAEFLMFSSAYGVLSKSDGADAVIAKLQAMGE
jgi:cobalt-precorrin-5B (C1)-methyltransferase